MSVIQLIITLVIVWIISLVTEYMFQFPFKVYDAVEWSWLEIRFYQEPQRSFIALGCNTLEVGWVNPIFVLQFLFWSVEVELDFYEERR